MRILVFGEDDDNMSVLADDLKSLRVEPTLTSSANSALDSLAAFDAVLVSFGESAPALERLGMCCALRAKSDVPIVALVPAPKVGERILQMRAGIDAYLCKPYRAGALVARLDGLNRCARGFDAPDVLHLEDVMIDFQGRTVTVAGETLELTTIQFKILALLAEKFGAVCSKDSLVSRIWGCSGPSAEQNLYVHIKILRDKIGRPHLIETVRGAGYRLAMPKPRPRAGRVEPIARRLSPQTDPERCTETKRLMQKSFENI